MKDADPQALTLRAVLPGLVFIALIDLMTLVGLGDRLEPFVGMWPLVAVLLPWVTILVLRKPAAVLGYGRNRSLAAFGWGMLAGAIWRGLSLAVNVWLQGGWTQLSWGGRNWLVALLWVPFAEETFFRGYLGRALANNLGAWSGIGVQALLFSFHPGHWSQGWPHLLSILAFGLLAGWLMWRFQSIWSSWGAHALANVLPEILLLLKRAI